MNAPLLLSQLNPENNLQDALTRLESEVRSVPGSAAHRWALAELLCVLGQWERALKQLQVGAKVAESTDTQWQAKAQMLRGLIRAEAERHEVFAGQLLPVPVIDRPQWMEDLARAMGLNTTGDHAQADKLRRKALEQAPTRAGSCHWQSEAAQDQALVEQPFAWISDTDTRLGPVCECMLAGRYRWLAYADIATIRIEPPSSLLDLVWLPVTLTLRDTAASMAPLRGFVPARYSGTEDIAAEMGSSQRDALMLARLTRWQDVGTTGVFALGQKTLMTSEGDIPLMRIRTLRMNSGPQPQEGSA